MLIVVVGKSGSGKTYFTNHLLFNLVEGLGGATGTTRYFEDDVYAKKDLTNEILEKLDKKENVVVEVRDIEDIDPILRRTVNCYVFTSRFLRWSRTGYTSDIYQFASANEIVRDRLKEVMDITFGLSEGVGVKSYPRVIFNREKNTLMTQVDYEL